MENYELEVIASKPPIVATHVGDFSQGSDATVQRYEEENATFIRPPAVQSYQRRLMSNILKGDTSVGCLVAPFGYGKTSTAIDVWSTAADSNLLAVPPFSCSSVAEMGEAIASGVAIVLETEFPDAARKVNDAYEAYLESSAHRIALHDVKKYGIEFDAAIRSIQEKIEKGYLHLEASGTNLLAFLEETVDIVTQVGFEGMLVIVDEFQQFLGTINKAVVTNFRTLIWGLKTRDSLPLGLLITMDPDTERNLSERAGDVLHRIKEDGLYLQFSSVYDREFPRLLWDRYAETFGFRDTSQSIIDRATLEAIGQICERSDLSNGPRTVIDVFQRVANLHASRSAPYSPIDLVNDFVGGEIRFDGDRNKMASLVNELTSYDYIRRLPARVKTLKLMAAFPRGCPREIAESYNLADEFEQLTDELRGEIVIELPEGTALVDLQRIGKPQNKLNIILKKYWMQITEEEIIAERVLPLFCSYAIDPLFPAFGNVFSGWRRLEDDFSLTPEGGYLQIYEGTFFEEFPMRRVAVQVCRDPNQAIDAQAMDEDIDLNLVFMLDCNEEAGKCSRYYNHHRTFVFTIPVRQPFSRSLSRDIRWIEDYLSPVALTPGVLLSLIDYIRSQVPRIDGMSEAEHRRIEDIQRKLQEFLAVMIFDGTIFEAVEIPIVSRGPQALREALFSIFQSLYPNYQTLLSSLQWERALETYLKVLNSLSLLQRRGLESLSERKSRIAERFGRRSHAGFESYIKRFGPLLDLKDWSGNRGEIYFTSHPAEVHLLKLMTSEERISHNILVNELAMTGYTRREANYLLELMEARGHIRRDPDSRIYSPTTDLTVKELDRLGQELAYELRVLHSVMRDETLVEEKSRLSKLLEGLEEEGESSEAQLHLVQMQSHLHQLRSEARERLYSSLSKIRNQLYEHIEYFSQELPLLETELLIDTHINGIQRNLVRDNSVVVSKLESLARRITDALLQPTRFADMSLEQLDTAVTEYLILREEAIVEIEELESDISQREIYYSWVELAEQIRRLFDYLDRASQITEVSHLRGLLEETIEAIATDFATVGMKKAVQIHDRYSHRVEELSRELDTAIRLVELSEAKPLSSSSSAQGDESSNLLNILQHSKSTKLSELVERSELLPRVILNTLAELERKGKIVIKIERV